MPTEVVVDSSVVTALVTAEECSDWAQKKMGESEYFHILDLTYYEVANAIKYKTTARFTAKDAANAFKEASELMNLYAVHNFSEVIADAMSLALKLKITVYDAACLSLANKLDMRLITIDLKLAEALESTKYHGIIDCPNK